MEAWNLQLVNYFYHMELLLQSFCLTHLLNVVSTTAIIHLNITDITGLATDIFLLLLSPKMSDFPFTYFNYLNLSKFLEMILLLSNSQEASQLT